jgi:histidyl-tRNA synthetase
VFTCCTAGTVEELLIQLPEQFADSSPIAELRELFTALKNARISNALFDVSLVRGFDYYTGIVFELFDTNPENSRSLFGGGRYDGLTEIFDTPPIAAVGFGMGDVTIRNFLETRNLLPAYRGTADLFLCTTDATHLAEAQRLARALRGQEINVEVNLSDKRVGDQIRSADKKAVPFVVCIGPEEVTTRQYKVKNLATSEETKLPEIDIAAFIEKQKLQR